MQKRKFLAKLEEKAEKMGMNKRGQIINTASGTIIGIVIFLLIVFASLYGIAQLNPSSFFTAGSNSANATQAIQDNLTLMISAFSQRLVVVGTILGVVLVLGVLGLLLFVVLRFRQAAGSSNTL